MKEQKSKPKAGSSAKAQVSEVRPTYPSRYKNDKTDSKTMKKVEANYSSRYK